MARMFINRHGEVFEIYEVPGGYTSVRVEHPDEEHLDDVILGMWQIVAYRVEERVKNGEL